MTRDGLVELLAEHIMFWDRGACRCGKWWPAPDITSGWAGHVADEIAAKDWCVVLK